jgi:hypothetical protein
MLLHVFKSIDLSCRDSKEIKIEDILCIYEPTIMK